MIRPVSEESNEMVEADKLFALYGNAVLLQEQLWKEGNYDIGLVSALLKRAPAAIKKAPAVTQKGLPGLVWEYARTSLRGLTIPKVGGWKNRWQRICQYSLLHRWKRVYERERAKRPEPLKVRGEDTQMVP